MNTIQSVAVDTQGIYRKLEKHDFDLCESAGVHQHMVLEYVQQHAGCTKMECGHPASIQRCLDKGYAKFRSLNPKERNRNKRGRRRLYITGTGIEVLGYGR